MATPAFLRYLPARLKPLSSPAVWAPLTVFTLLSVFIWEYHKNPDWFNRPQISNADPNSNLTPEEQARLSEIDTLDLLLRNARTPGGDDLSTSLINPAEQNPLAETKAAPDRSLANRDNPFAAYEAQYQFPGSSGLGSAAPSQPARLQTPAASAASSLDVATPSSGSNALSEALNRQQSARSETGDRPSLSLESQGSSSSINPQRSNPAGSSSDRFDGLSEGAANVGNTNAGNDGGSLAFPTQVPSSNGISEPFIRTTPDMSPPVGTTGYQVPASANLPVFNVPTQQPTRNPFSQPSRLSSPAAPNAASTPATPNVNYTAPSFTQPEQDRRR